jgi:hypothetical protein
MKTEYIAELLADAREEDLTLSPHLVVKIKDVLNIRLADTERYQARLVGLLHEVVQLSKDGVFPRL